MRSRAYRLARYSLARGSALESAREFVPDVRGVSRCLGCLQVVYYGVLGAQRQHPLHSIMVFDLGGISHFAKDNVFPGSWSKDEAALITDGCYKPLAWDIYWTQQPCAFVMEHLEREKIFPSPVLTEAWRRAIVSHPIAYLEHRATFMATFLGCARHYDVDARPRRRLENHICG